MKNLVKSVTMLVLCIFFYDTASAQVTCDYDKDVNFSEYKTYSFGGWQKDSEKLINDIDKKTILQSFKAEFAARGLTYQETDADAIVTFYIVIDNKSSTTAYTDFNGGMGMGYGYGAGFARPAWGWGTGSATTTYSEDDYQVGTFVVDFYDTKSKKLIWQGVSKETINENASKRSKTIPKDISKIMKKYPVEAAK